MGQKIKNGGLDAGAENKKWWVENKKWVRGGRERHGTAAKGK